jgi:hypothetical protein
MTRPNVTEIDAATGVVVVREMNDTEFSQYETDQAAQAETVVD